MNQVPFKVIDATSRKTEFRNRRIKELFQHPMKTLYKYVVAAAWGMALCQSARADSTCLSVSYSPLLSIPDYDPTSTGASDTQTVSLPGASSITSLSVSLDINGGYNGDYYVYLSHGDSFAVLLNRVGTTASDSYGYADSGFNVTFSDNAANGDIHLYQTVFNPQGSALTGSWQPDGRNVDPFVVNDTSGRTAFLNSFIGSDANGTWTLYLYDTSALSQGTLVSWGLNITADVAVPEPSTAFLGFLGLAVFLMRNRGYRERNGVGG